MWPINQIQSHLNLRVIINFNLVDFLYQFNPRSNYIMELFYLMKYNLYSIKLHDTNYLSLYNNQFKILIYLKEKSIKSSSSFYINSNYGAVVKPTIL
ncbi:hypothetical protein pb186bvf_004998 [Paramecium bursaria]